MNSRRGVAVLVLLAGLLPGCAVTPKPIFPEFQPPLVWPPEPALPRIRYVGQLRSATDLKAPPKPLAALGNLVLGAADPPRLFGPRSVMCTADGQRLWVADPGGRCLHLFDLERRAYRRLEFAGKRKLALPVGVCAGPRDSLYVCDSEDVQIHRLSATTGDLLESLKLPPEIERPVAVRYRPVPDELFVVDSAAHDIKVLGPSGALLRIIGRRGAAPGDFNFPCGVADDGRLLWVVDAGNHRVQSLSASGEPAGRFGQAGDMPGDLALPKDVALDSEGHVYVVDARFENVQVFDSRGVLLLGFGHEGNGPGEFSLPSGIFIDALDRIWICDSYNGRIQLFQYIKQPGHGPTSNPIDAPLALRHRRDASAPRDPDERAFP